jgi:Tol biopolymer transport system component
MMLFTHCSHDSPVKPPSEEGPVHKIVFSAKDPQGQYKLYTINDDGSDLKEIFTNNVEIGDLRVSPQGNRVVCAVHTSISSSSDYELFLVNIDSGRAIRITATGNGVIEEPQWFPNGEELIFGKSKPYGMQFYRIHAMAQT